MNTLPTQDPMRPRTNNSAQHVEQDQRTPEGSRTLEWHEQVHRDLRGHTLQEQEQMLAPERSSSLSPAIGSIEPSSPFSLDTIKEAKQAPPKPRTPPGRPSKGPPQRKPDHDKTKPEDLPKVPSTKGKEAKRPALKRDRREPPRLPQENKRVSERLTQAGKAADMIKQGVERAATTHEAKAKARLADMKKEGKKTKLTPLPPLDHAGAALALGHTKSILEHDAKSAATMVEPVPPALLPAAAGTVDSTADRIAKKVEAPHVESTRDLAVGIREGDEAMIRRVIGRAGDISYATLQVGRNLSTNKEANVYEAKYLGMAPVVYKRSRVEDQESEESDPTLREHKTMSSLEADPNLLRAGGKTLETRGFIMELVKKGDLAGVREKLVKLPLSERVEVWRHLMRSGFQALVKVHGTGRSHGDIKNQNFLLGEDYEPKLMDFGTTRNEEDANRSGTAEYMAPEVPRTHKADKASDVWSMGESLLLGVFGMNSSDFARGAKGANPVRFEEEMARARQVADGKWLTHVRDQVKGMPDAEVFMDFIEKVMAYDPKKRLTSKEALRHEFLKLAKDGRNLGKEKLRELV